MKTTIKRSKKTENYLTVNMQDMTTGKLLALLQALKNYESIVAHDVFCSIRNAMVFTSNDPELRQAFKLFEDSQKKELTTTE